MVGVIGLGLIGGSMAKAFNQLPEKNVYGYDANPEVLRRAMLVNAIEEELTLKNLPYCDLVIIALYPEDTKIALEKYAPYIKPGAIVMDCAGVKRDICPLGNQLAADHGFYFVGGHPMAGIEHSGFAYARKALFNNASIVLTPPTGTPIQVVDVLKKALVSIGFTNVEITTPEEHDRMIAFTSQLAHVVSSAYIKSPTAERHAGFSAGSYRDLTRVAKLNESMWTELFLDNRDHLSAEIDGLVERLQAYSDAIKKGDARTLESLLQEGRLRKESIDNETF